MSQSIIQQLLAWTEEEYLTTIYSTGLDYLGEYLDGDNEGQRLLAGHKPYWDWFKREWDKRNESFLKEIEGFRFSRGWLKKMYMGIHDATTLSSEQKPPRDVVADALVNCV